MVATAEGDGLPSGHREEGAPGTARARGGAWASVRTPRPTAVRRALGNPTR
jgi:hypothetical protein